MTLVLDRFQREAIAALDAGRSVLVAAPTGAGKTLVAEHAVRRALADGGKAFYTTPIKALSNQKFADLRAELGDERVGLLTGDRSVNGDAPVVVMTTEVLRNMLYARSPALDGLQYVVLDEVHYLQDTYRGPVWEEVIIHLPATVLLVCLSATVSNAGELGGWLDAVRGPTAVVVETERPVDLRHLYLVGDRSSGGVRLIRTLVDGRANEEALRLEEGRPGPRGGRPRRRLFTPRRLEVLDVLLEHDLIPAIDFVFSRAGCDESVRSFVEAGVDLTTDDDKTQIRAIAEAQVAGLSADDLGVLEYDPWLAALEAGVAAHHAGHVAPFKQAVEACFAAGLVKIVFATETLALGINMPARTVVIERLSRFRGDGHEALTPGEFTQLTGRAGRRGIDPVGHAVVVWNPFVRFEQVATLARSRQFALRSAFRPTYNMAVNIVERHSAEQAHHILGRSFAQFQSDASVVHLEHRVDLREQDVTRLEHEARCDLGDVAEYVALLDQKPKRGTRAAIERSLGGLAPGDVVRAEGAPAAVLSVAQRKGTVRVRAVDASGSVQTWRARDLSAVVEHLTSVDLPTPYDPGAAAFARAVAGSLEDLAIPSRSPAPGSGRPTHPVAACPDRDGHVRAHRRLDRARADLARVRRRVERQQGQVVVQFASVLRVLEARGFVDGWAVTVRGRVLAGVFHESDILVAEAVVSGSLDDLEPPAMAALTSLFTYEHRSRDDPPPPRFPDAETRKRAGLLDDCWAHLAADEEAAGLQTTRPPDPGFVERVHGWATGRRLADVVDEDMTAGDFVRNVRQVIDLLGQIAVVAPRPATRAAADQAAASLDRGLVTASAAGSA